jgi:hypothetical protein
LPALPQQLRAPLLSTRRCEPKTRKSAGKPRLLLLLLLLLLLMMMMMMSRLFAKDADLV